MIKNNIVKMSMLLFFISLFSSIQGSSPAQPSAPPRKFNPCDIVRIKNGQDEGKVGVIGITMSLQYGSEDQVIECIKNVAQAGSGYSLSDTQVQALNQTMQNVKNSNPNTNIPFHNIYFVRSDNMSGIYHEEALEKILPRVSLLVNTKKEQN